MTSSYLFIRPPLDNDFILGGNVFLVIGSLHRSVLVITCIRIGSGDYRWFRTTESTIYSDFRRL